MLHCSEVPDLPRLAWLAVVEPERAHARVLHGALVERRPDWIVEGVWDGPFEEGAFDESENFFGSGLRVRGSSFVVTASTSLTDRVLYCELAHATVASNSLPLLLGAMGGRLRPEHDYAPECHASLMGIWSYPRDIPIEHETVPRIRQLIHGNLRVSATAREERVRSRRRPIGSYSEYVALLDQALAEIRGNATAPGRRAPLEGVTTVSTGYDSAAVSCLVRPLGVGMCFTTRPGDSTDARGLEDGTSLARALGYQPMLLSPPGGSHESDLWEPFFLAGTFDGSELIFESLAQFVSTLEGGAVLWTGYHGDKAWDVNVDVKYQKDDILRGDISGLNLSEVRLASGFVHVAVPFMYARGVGDLVRIGASDEMAPWRLNNAYDRPIARRIVESAGVDRHLFGRGKRVVMRYENLPNHRRLRREFLDFVAETTPLGRWHATTQEWLSRGDYLLERMRASAGLAPVVPEWLGGMKRRVIPPYADLQQLMFKWAVARLASRYRRAVGHLLPSI
jgi:hypothetical protein